MSVEYERVYPGVYGEREGDLIERVRAEFEGRGPHVPEGHGVTPGFELYVDRKHLLDFAHMWNRYNPLYTDPEYAKRSRFHGFIAAPWAVIAGSSFPFLPKKTGVWISALCHLPMKALDHEYTFYRPIYEGDTVHTETTFQGFDDISPKEGGDVRLFRLRGEGDLVNNHGEVVISAKFRAGEAFHVLKDPEDLKKLDRPEYYWPPFTFDWPSVRKQHVYTDEDWEYIKDLWSKEYVRGADTLYWEDVNIGDEPAWTCDGPLTHSDYHQLVDEVFDWYGREKEPMRLEFTRDLIMHPDPDDKERMIRDPYGMWQDIHNLHDEGCNIPNARASCMNTDGRNFSTRVITNWMGDAGWIRKGCWRLSFGWDIGHNMFPADCERPSYLLKVPYLKEQGKFMNTHAFEGDCIISKAYVCDKYIDERGVHCVDLVAWCETIEGDIFAENYYVVELPSRADSK